MVLCRDGQESELRIRKTVESGSFVAQCAIQFRDPFLPKPNEVPNFHPPSMLCFAPAKWLSTRPPPSYCPCCQPTWSCCLHFYYHGQRQQAGSPSGSWVCCLFTCAHRQVDHGYQLGIGHLLVVSGSLPCWHSGSDGSSAK